MAHDIWSSASEDHEQFNQMLIALLSRICLVYGVQACAYVIALRVLLSNINQQDK